MKENPGEQIRKIRNKLGLSQTRFGRKVGVSGKSISAYETGKVNPPLKVLERISSTYQVSIKTPNLKTRKMILKKIRHIQVQIEDIKSSLETY
jgi:transcriptional regulator with XRE-family HTH domain